MLANFIVAIVVGLGITQLANLATTMYLHRGLAHRSINMHGPLAIVFRFIVWTTVGIRPRQWAAVHRKHHAFTDVDGDPHSPALLGWRRVQFTNVALYRRVARNPIEVQRYARDLQATGLDRHLLDHALLGLGIGLSMLVVVMSVVFSFPIWVPLLAAAFHMVLYLGLSGSVNSIGHTFGRRPYENSGTNLHWLALLTCGEGYHNNHHAAPTSARFSLNRREFDPAWPVIRGAKALGLISVRHEMVKFGAPADRKLDAA
jgi:stearoyl-CoA desaturase (Delta-9 desaturase)